MNRLPFYAVINLPNGDEVIEAIRAKAPLFVEDGVATLHLPRGKVVTVDGPAEVTDNVRRLWEALTAHYPLEETFHRFRCRGGENEYTPWPMHDDKPREERALGEAIREARRVLSKPEDEERGGFMFGREVGNGSGKTADGTSDTHTVFRFLDENALVPPWAIENRVEKTRQLAAAHKMAKNAARLIDEAESIVAKIQEGKGVSFRLGLDALKRVSVAAGIARRFASGGASEYTTRLYRVSRLCMALHYAETPIAVSGTRFGRYGRRRPERGDSASPRPYKEDGRISGLALKEWAEKERFSGCASKGDASVDLRKPGTLDGGALPRSSREQLRVQLNLAQAEVDLVVAGVVDDKKRAAALSRMQEEFGAIVEAAEIAWIAPDKVHEAPPPYVPMP